MRLAAPWLLLGALAAAILPAAAQPAMSITAPSLDFGTQPVGHPGDTRDFVVGNAGSSALTVAVSLPGTDFQLVANGCSDPVPAGLSCTIQVRFQPTTVGARGTTLTIFGDDPVNPNDAFPLTGIGVAVDATPDAFTFVDVPSVPRDSVQTSNTVTITGINVPTDVSVTGGTYSIGCTATFTSGAETVVAGDTICVRHTASPLNATATDTVLTVGTYSDTFTSTTLPSFTLTAAAAGTGTGTITGTGVACPGDCTETVETSTLMVLTATATAGSAFAGWSGCDSVASEQCTVTVAANRTVTATFTASISYSVVLEGWQQVDPYVVTPALGSGTVVYHPVTHELAFNITYSGLTGNEWAAHIHGPAARGANGPFVADLSSGPVKADVVVLTSAQEAMLLAGQLYIVIHTFNHADGEIRGQIDNGGPTLRRTLTVSKSGTGIGTVTGTAQPGTVINCGSDCTESVPNGKTVTLTAVGGTGSGFNGWSGACTGTATCVVTMDAAKAVTAAFDNPPRLANISTRMRVGTGEDVLIGGFVIGGSADKTVVVRARGPSLSADGISNVLANPMLQIFSGQTQIAANDDFGTASNLAALQASGFAPSDPKEAAILIKLPPGPYTAIVSGVGGTTGIGLVEMFEVDRPDIPFVNIATRGNVRTGNEVMIGGFIIQGGVQSVVVRARGPSLASAGITNTLSDPSITLVRSADGQVIAANNNWETAANAAQILASGFAPSDPAESAILITLQPGAYTAIVSGSLGSTGVAIVEVFVN